MKERATALTAQCLCCNALFGEVAKVLLDPPAAHLADKLYRK